jgi:hypothetical protein
MNRIAISIPPPIVGFYPDTAPTGLRYHLLFLQDSYYRRAYTYSIHLLRPAHPHPRHPCYPWFHTASPQIIDYDNDHDHDNEILSIIFPET